LEIDIINGKDIPNGDDQMVALGKLIASSVKHALLDTGEYDSYKVLFMTVTENAGSTQRTWKGKIFSSNELLK
jgi:hypothetical protein